ncbi:MAG: DnaA/Hda family protein [Paracoccaceae bacterium]|nr:DnaA/Hda family protein [Paracoccaceae bacterium]
MTEQLAFEFPYRAAGGSENFYVTAANRHAVTILGDPSRWQNGGLLICGPPGSGKSHLADAWADRFGALRLDGESLAAVREPRGLTQEPVRRLVVEDVHRIAGDPRAERPLLHVINFLCGRRVPFLLTACGRPPDWPFVTPDLSSRIAAVSFAALEEPDDELLRALLAKLFEDRQLDCPPRVLDFLARRVERSYAAVIRTVDSLDHTSLDRRRPLTRALAAVVLDKLES